MTIAVDWDVKPQNNQTKTKILVFTFLCQYENVHVLLKKGGVIKRIGRISYDSLAGLEKSLNPIRSGKVV